MAKTKKSPAQKAKVPANRQRVLATTVKPSRGPFSSLCASSKAYAALLLDPCNGPLLPGPFGNGNGGLVARFERDFTIGVGALETAAAVAFIPGMPTVYNAATTSDTAALAWSQDTTKAPGTSYLGTNAIQVRCLSACVQVMWPGSELSRQGIISLGQGGAGGISSAITQIGQLRAAAQATERMPNDMLEIKWRPNDFEQNWNSAAGILGTPSNDELDKWSALYITASGMPASVGIRVRIVAVYEYIPRPDVMSGATTNIAKPSNTDTLGRVLSALDATGQWMISRGYMAARAASSLYAGVGAVYNVGAGVARIMA